MKKAPQVVRVDDVRRWLEVAQIDDEWVPARPLGLFTIPNRLRCAWLVFTGACDALRWQKGQ